MFHVNAARAASVPQAPVGRLTARNCSQNGVWEAFLGEAWQDQATCTWVAESRQVHGQQMSAARL